MNHDTVILSCSNCGAKNRVPKGRLKDNPVCGKCRTTLQPETTIIKCSECGAKNRLIKELLHDQPKCGKCHVPLKAIPYYNRPVMVTDGTFNQEILDCPGPALVDFYSTSCAYCTMLDPILNQLASEYAGRIKIGKLDIEQNPLTASRYDVMSTPTLILLKDGKQVNKLLGAMSKEEIVGHLKYILS